MFLCLKCLLSLSCVYFCVRSGLRAAKGAPLFSCLQPCMQRHTCCDVCILLCVCLHGFVCAGCFLFRLAACGGVRPVKAPVCRGGIVRRVNVRTHAAACVARSGLCLARARGWVGMLHRKVCTVASVPRFSARGAIARLPGWTVFITTVCGKSREWV